MGCPHGERQVKVSIQKPLHLGTELLLCSQRNISFCHLHWFLALEEKARGGLGASVPTFTRMSWSSIYASADVPKGFKRDEREKHPGHEPGDRDESWYLKGGASCSVSTPSHVLMGPSSEIMVVEILDLWEH